MTRDRPSMINEPRFCPRCPRVESAEDVLCRNCGERLVEKGYCAICEDYWPLEAGLPCPKHDLELESRESAGDDDAHGGQTRNWVTVATFQDPLKAGAARIRLEAEGIPTFLEGERMGSRSMYQVATGGVRLQVPELLSADARVLLAQTWSPSVVDDDLDDAWDELAPDPGAGRRAVMKGVIVFLLIAPLLMTLLGFVFGS